MWNFDYKKITAQLIHTYFKKTLNKHNIMDMPSFMSKHTVFFFISKKTFIEKKNYFKMRHEVAKRITNNKNLCTYQKKKKNLCTRKKRIYKHWNGIT